MVCNTSFFKNFIVLTHCLHCFHHLWNQSLLSRRVYVVLDSPPLRAPGYTHPQLRPESKGLTYLNRCTSTVFVREVLLSCHVPSFMPTHNLCLTSRQTVERSKSLDRRTISVNLGWDLVNFVLATSSPGSVTTKTKTKNFEGTTKDMSVSTWVIRFNRQELIPHPWMTTN